MKMAKVTFAVAALSVSCCSASIFPRSAARAAAAAVAPRRWFAAGADHHLATTATRVPFLTVPRGGGAPGEEREVKEAAAQETVDASELYLPGLLETVIHRSKDVSTLGCS